MRNMVGVEVSIMTIEHNAKNQHYVWQHYLRAWAPSGKFWCYRQKDRKFFNSTPGKVARERYFYKMQQLTDADKLFLEEVISRASDERLRELNRDYVKLTQLSFELRTQLQDTKLPTEVRVDLDEQLRWAERNLGEQYHTGIENTCLDILDWLRNGNDTFYQDVNRCGDFLYFLSLQYFRTAKMRDGLRNITSHVPGHDPRRTVGILNHIHATNVATGLFRERNAYRIIFLRNATAVPFIAGDQPVINMLDPMATDDLELYYPLSPVLAIALSKDGVRFPGRERNLTLFEVERYNYAIYSKSEDQVYSNDESYLRSIVAMRKNVLAS
jgi:hypothetical protein